MYFYFKISTIISNIYCLFIQITKLNLKINTFVYVLIQIHSILGTKEDIECSGQGICQETTGICSCIAGFQSSNGNIDAAGERGDCSFLNPFYTVNYKKPIEDVTKRERPLKKLLLNEYNYVLT